MYILSKSNENIAPDTFQKMSRTLIDKIHDELKNKILMETYHYKICEPLKQ